MVGIGFAGIIGPAAAGYPKKPTAPLSVTANNDTTYGAMTLSWTAPTNTGFPAITSYTVEVVGVTTINTGNANTTYTWTGGTRGSSYQFRVYSNNSAGQSPASNTTASTMILGNVASGGAVTDVSNYNGTGQTWRVHTFTGAGTFVPTTVTSEFRTLVIAGGGGGGSSHGKPGAGGAGGLLYNASNTLLTQTYPISIGGGGAGGSYEPQPVGNPGANGSNSTAFGLTAIGGGGGGNYNYGGRSGGSGGGGSYYISSGGGGGAGTPGQGYPGGSSAPGPGPIPGFGGGGGGAGGAGGVNVAGPGLSLNITGTPTTYASGAGPGGTGGYGAGGGTGTAGVTIVAYRLT